MEGRLVRVTRGNEVALWSGGAAFFGSVLAVGVFDLLDITGWAELLSSIIVAGFTGGAVYCQQRLTAAKERDNGD